MMASMYRTASEKVKKISELSHIAGRLKKEGKKIVLAFGVFDLIHPGHIRHLAAAKKHGDVLFVIIPDDRFVGKGPGWPIFHQNLRSEVLASIGLVDYVGIVSSRSAAPAIAAIEPDIYAKGPDKKPMRKRRQLPASTGEEEKALVSYGGKVVYTDDELVFSSSQLINRYLDVYPPKTKSFLAQFKKRYSAEEIIEQLYRLKKLSILVVGDAIIDQYVYSDPMGKSTKEPITVHKFISEESFAGGTLATANHLAALSGAVTLVTLLGSKRSFEPFVRRHMRPHVKLKLFYQDRSDTLIKRRYIDQTTKQKLFQISYIKDDLPLGPVEQRIVTYIKTELSKYDMVIINDFGHGLLSKKIIRAIYSKAKYIALNVQANSANYGFNIITKYPRAHYVCIDEMELRLATHNRYGELPILIKRIFSKLSADQMIITRGPHGANSYSVKTGLLSVPALTQLVIDRVGAGDALYAISAPCIYTGMDLEVATFVGNVAGALQVATIGNKYPIGFDDLVNFITRLLK